VDVDYVSGPGIADSGTAKFNTAGTRLGPPPDFVINLGMGTNQLGVEVLAKTGADTNWWWAGFSWLTVERTNGMAFIPAGPFTMGDALGDTVLWGNSDQLPTHTVNVSAFYMDQCLVTGSLSDPIVTWAGTNGYEFDIGLASKAPSHPTIACSWYDAVRWCNARSQKDGLTPCYYTDAGLTNIYKTGSYTNTYVNWNASGYRLPTEAEWEKAARGGFSGHRFPWSDVDTISWDQANYMDITYTNEHPAYDLSPLLPPNTQVYDPAYDDGSGLCTSPVGSFPANGYGLYDMAGNEEEWCWDWLDDDWYGKAGAVVDDTRGPASGSDPDYPERVRRGGAFMFESDMATCAFRDGGGPDDGGQWFTGFRCVRKP
jgi:formylglycine-generating enzyme required for sulfatase activity